MASERSQTVKEMAKSTQDLTAMITEWSNKIKKEQENAQLASKQEIEAQKKWNVEEASKIWEDLKNMINEKTENIEKKLT